MAAIALQARDPEAVMAVLTADHIFKHEEIFRGLLLAAYEAAQQDHLVTLGIAPTYAATGYGYIQRSELVARYSDLNAFRVLHFIENLHVVKDNLFPLPPLFKIIQEQSGTDWAEMYSVFNMGHRMELYVPEDIALDIIQISENFNVDARIIGHCEAAPAKRLTIRSEFGVFDY